MRFGRRGSKPGRWKSLRALRQETGAAALEFAFASLLFFTLFFGIMELGLMYWVNLTMQHAVREGARYAITGLADKDPTPTEGEGGEKFFDRQRAVTQKIKESSMGLYDRVNPKLQVSAPDGSVFSGYGTSGDIIVISLECSWPLLTPLVSHFFSDGSYRFTVSATMRNEAF